MLRSYQYTNTSYLEHSLHDEFSREYEVNFAKRFVMENPSMKRSNVRCPVCQKGTGEFFYNKWDIDYMRCNKCKSVFAIVDDDALKKYNDSPELKKFRTEKNYQEMASTNRHGIWQENIDWIMLRTFRFCKQNKGLAVVDIGNRFEKYVDMIKSSPLCKAYDLRKSILCEDNLTISNGNADLVLCFDYMQGSKNPEERLLEVKKYLKEDGLLILGTRAGSGFDILTLKGKNEKIYPYEHIMLPSLEGLTELLEKTGYEVLELTTPGVMDVKYVFDYKDKLGDRETFVKSLLETGFQGMLQEFQRFLQKSGMSSFVRVIAKKGRE